MVQSEALLIFLSLTALVLTVKLVKMQDTKQYFFTDQSPFYGIR